MTGIELQSQDHRTLLDIVDKLRLTGITRYIDLPQIVVCGDQSAGKSSVLEAISGIRFPTKDNLCTRFATELILRRDEEVTVKASIVPGPDRDEGERRRLSLFDYEVDIADPDLSGLIDEAKQAMGLSDTKVFSSDVLRVELGGPQQPHLTLVDLPGLFRAGNREQSADEAPMVHQMVRGYMERPRSIILAVVSAKSDFALQEVTKYSLELDPQGVRTLGLITKPDTLSRGSESETAYIAMAQNKDVVFRLGWHVLKNRSFETREVSARVRDSQEAHFFGSGAWASLNPSTVGITSLKPRLSNILRDQILDNLPGLHADVLSGIKDCETRLEQLGEPRVTAEEQRRYLQHVSWKFSVLLRAAIDGVYNDLFFGHARTEQGQRKRLRAVVQNSLEDFAESVRTRGHTVLIVDDDRDHAGGEHPGCISRSAYIASTKQLMRHSRGTELSGTFKPEIIGELFREQCQPWRGLATQVRLSILQSVRWTARAALEAVAVIDTVDPLFAVIDRAIDGLGQNVEAKVEELLRPHLEGHPITYNHYLISNVQKIQADRRRKELDDAIQKRLIPRHTNFALDEEAFKEDLSNIIHDREEVDMGHHASQLAVDYMQAYYQVAMKNWVDDVGIYAIEEQLIQRLPPIFDHRMIERLSDSDVAHLTAEKPDAARDRTHNAEKLANLRKSLRELESLDTHRLRTHTPPAPDVESDCPSPATADTRLTLEPRPQTPVSDDAAAAAAGKDGTDVPVESSPIAEEVDAWGSFTSTRAKKMPLRKKIAFID